MNLKCLRIFVTTSHINTVYITLLAQHTRQDHHIDILLIDASKRRKTLVKLIGETSEFHPWSFIHDFSVTNEAYDYNPSIRKSWTRKLKDRPVIRTVYRFLLERHLIKKDSQYKLQLSDLLAPHLQDVGKIELYALTQTYLNRPLQQLFPEASINYLEHGIGDYYFILDPELPKGNLYCIFHEEYKRYLEKKGESSHWVKSLPGINTFPEFAAQLLIRHAKTLSIDQLRVPEKPCVFVLLEAVDLYNVKSSFWSAYLDRIFAQLTDPSRYHYLLKPHPMQSEVSIAASRAHFDKLGYEFTLLDQPAIASASAEVLFSLWAKKTEHVFCLYSSGCFYLSKLYANCGIRFWYSTEFMSKHISNAPPRFYKGFIEARPIIEEVFTGNCTAYN